MTSETLPVVTAAHEPFDGGSEGEYIGGQIARLCELSSLTGTYVEGRIGDWTILMSPHVIRLKSSD